MTRFVLVLMAALAVASPALAAPQTPTFDEESQQADVIFTGKLVAVGKSPGFWSGGIMAIQTLTYDVIKVTKGTEKNKRVDVRYIIVGAPYIEPGKPEVAARLTKIGASYTVLVKDYPDGRFAIDAKPVP